MTKIILFITLLGIFACANGYIYTRSTDHVADHDPEHPHHQSGFSHLTHKLVNETKTAGHEVYSAAADVAKKISRTVRSVVANGELPSLLQNAHDAVKNFSQLNTTEAGHRVARMINEIIHNGAGYPGYYQTIAMRSGEDIGDIKTNLTADGVTKERQYYNPAPSYSTSTPYYASTSTPYYTTTTPYYTTTTHRPIIKIEKGPIGPQGQIGLPGLPGLPGIAANLKPLTLVVAARLDRLIKLVKKVFIFSCLKAAGLLALILGLVIPIYGKFKKAGVVIPVGYAPAPVEESYAPAPYAPARGYDAAPVQNAIDQGYKKYQ